MNWNSLGTSGAWTLLAKFSWHVPWSPVCTLPLRMLHKALSGPKSWPTSITWMGRFSFGSPMSIAPGLHLLQL